MVTDGYKTVTSDNRIKNKHIYSYEHSYSKFWQIHMTMSNLSVYIKNDIYVGHLDTIAEKFDKSSESTHREESIPITCTLEKTYINTDTVINTLLGTKL